MSDGQKLNPLFDPATDNQSIDPTVQAEINKPLSAGAAFSPEDQAFLDLVMKLIEEKKINLYAPSSLLNEAVYSTLSEENKAKADQNTVTMLARIRDIHDLMSINPEPSYQVKNLVATLRLQKERLEAAGGNTFIL